MFISLDYITFDTKKRNVYALHDTCFMHTIYSPYNAPSLRNQPNPVANTVTLLSLIKHYESINRNVARNIAAYYSWLYCTRFAITGEFVEKQFKILDANMIDMNVMHKYYNNVKWYLFHHHKIVI
jgi:hypothetical protein